MQYVSFGNTGMEVSRLCLGTMTFGREMDEQTCAKVLDEAIDQGVNFIDTAESYREAEGILGRLIGKRRDDLFLATKVHRKHARGGHVGRNSRTNILCSLERSLGLLRTDHVDLFMLHHPDEQTPIQETLATLDRLVKEGKVRHVGVSNHYAWQMAHMLGEANLRDWEPIISIQCAHNILDRAIERETLPFVRRFNMAMMVYAPLCGGILSGKYRRDQQAPQGSRGETNPKMKRYLTNPHTYDVVEALSGIAGELDVSLPQLAMMWLLGKPYVTAPVLGGTKAEHFSLMYDIVDKPLSEKDMARIDELSDAWRFAPFLNQPRAKGAPLAAQW